MAGVKFSRSEFEKSVKITEEIKDKISMFGTPFEGMNDTEVEIEIFPNRPDLLSITGYLRAIEAYLGKKGKKGLREYKITESKYQMKVSESMIKEWPYAYSCVVKGLKLTNEKIKDIIQLQEKLGATILRNRKKGGLGVYPLEKIKFPIKFEERKESEIVFRPLGMNDYITGRKILELHPTGIKYSNICKDWEKLPVFVDAKDNIMSMPPIINSSDLGQVETTTTEVFLEATGTDKKVLQKSLTILATALADMGGKIYSVECQQSDGSTNHQPILEKEKMKLETKNIEKTLGIKISEKEIKELLERMGYDYDEKKKEVTIPSWRVDILHEVDIIEDIAIAYGYDKFEAEIPTSHSTIGEESKKSIFIKKITEILIGLGALETSGYQLLRLSDLEKTGQRSHFKVKESKTDYKYLRSNLFTGTLKILSENIDSEYPQKIFEIGTVFIKDKKRKSETGIGEKTKLVFANTPGNFTDIKQVLDYLMKMINVNWRIEEGKKKGLIEGRTGRIIVEGKKVGFIGEVHPAILGNLRIKMPVAIFELGLKELYCAMKN